MHIKMSEKVAYQIIFSKYVCIETVTVFLYIKLLRDRHAF
jgi:hypothetical protein